MIERRAIDIIQPDLLTAGGMLETKKISDYAERHGMPTVLRRAGAPSALPDTDGRLCGWECQSDLAPQ